MDDKERFDGGMKIRRHHDMGAVEGVRLDRFIHRRERRRHFPFARQSGAGGFAGVYHRGHRQPQGLQDLGMHIGNISRADKANAPGRFGVRHDQSQPVMRRRLSI